MLARRRRVPPTGELQARPAKEATARRGRRANIPSREVGGNGALPPPLLPALSPAVTQRRPVLHRYNRLRPDNRPALSYHSFYSHALFIARRMDRVPVRPASVFRVVGPHCS